MCHCCKIGNHICISSLLRLLNYMFLTFPTHKYKTILSFSGHECRLDLSRHGHLTVFVQLGTLNFKYVFHFTEMNKCHTIWKTTRLVLHTLDIVSPYRLNQNKTARLFLFRKKTMYVVYDNSVKLNVLYFYSNILVRINRNSRRAVLFTP